MATTITVRDETPGRGMTNELTLDFFTERVMVRELIRSRVYQEVQDYNRTAPGYFRGLVQPAEAEKVLNGYKIRQGRQLDWKEQYQKALEAFQANGVLILVDDRQVESLDEEVELKAGTQVTFLRLVALVGG
ncbi:MAG TPA: hypothetical protein VKD72_09250 [Gemmataceae bacterium]|nr:hypothetical protein [Gemmataceae bacterium]